MNPVRNDATLAVRVKPRAKRAGIVGRHGDGIKVAVRAAPERGRANDELAQLLAEAFRVAPSDVEIVAGATSQDKKVRLIGVSASAVEQRTMELLGESKSSESSD